MKRQVTKGPISAGRQWEELRFVSRQPGEGAGSVDLPQARRGSRISGSPSGDLDGSV